MSKTNIEYFNYTLKLFINDIIKIKPDYKNTLEEYYTELLELENCNDDKYIKRFMRKTEDYKKLISEKNEDLFNESILLLKNIDFHELWNSEGITNEYKETIWEYIQTLYVLGETIISDSDKIKNLVENFKKIRNKEEVISENEGDDDLINMIKNLSENQGKENTLFDENLLEKGLIGGLAKELAEDINLNDLNLNLSEDSENINDVFTNLLSGDNPMNFMNLIQNVGQKIQSKLESSDLDQDKLMKEAQTMMGMLGNNNPLFDNMLKTAKSTLAQEKSSEPINPTQERLRKKLESRKNKK
jgi:hypothetical protein